MANKIKILIQGRSGKMGGEIEKLLSHHKHAQVCDLELNQATKKDVDVVIDFSSPAGMRASLKWCVKMKVPFVSGTTGIYSADLKSLKAAGKKTPVLWSPNMSVGINLFLKLIQSLGKIVSHYDLQIEEAHHSRKKDSPSGTAKILQAEVERVGKIKLPSVLSTRGGGIIGIHKLHLMDEEEILTIEHTALQRSVFAKGAIAAAIWLSKKQPGFYNMQDVLGE